MLRGLYRPQHSAQVLKQPALVPPQYLRAFLIGLNLIKNRYVTFFWMLHRCITGSPGWQSAAAPQRVGAFAGIRIMMKVITLGLSFSMMKIPITLAITPVSLAPMVPFLVITVVNLLMAGSLFKNVIDPAQAPAKVSS